VKAVEKLPKPDAFAMRGVFMVIGVATGAAALVVVLEWIVFLQHRRKLATQVGRVHLDFSDCDLFPSSTC
jgi:hypothetical protein